MSRVEFSEEEAHKLLRSPGMRRFLDKLGFQIVGTAVPYSGVDTGRLINSMSHIVEVEGEDLVLRCGSGTADGVEGPVYAWWHWGGIAPPTGEKDDRRVLRGRRIPHATKPGPTRPFTNALRQLGITYTNHGAGDL